MFGFLRTLFRNPSAPEPPNGEIAAVVESSLPPAPPEPIACETPDPSPCGEFLELPSKPILDRISEPLATAARRIFGSNGCILIPLNVVLPQLSQGCVKITFGDLKRSAPAARSIDSDEHDRVPILLPLPEIVSRLRPSQLPRRAGQKRFDVPDEIPALFCPQHPLADRSANAATIPMAEVDEPSKPNLPSAAVDALTLDPEKVLAVPLSSVAGFWPETVRQELSQADARSTVTLLPLKELEAGLKRGKVTFPWKQLRAWIQPRLSSSNGAVADEAIVELPLSLVAPQFLARRRPVPPRKPRFDVADSIPRLFGPPPPIPPAIANGTDEGSVLPLANCLPAEPVGSATPPSTRQQEVSVIGDAPLSQPIVCATGRPQLSETPNGGGVRENAAGLRGNEEISAALSPTQPQFPKDHRQLGQLFGQPAKRTWTVSEIAEHTARLKGVAGALLVTLDGLLIAAEMPAGLVSDTLAAFVPQMFLRIVQYAKELKFGEPRHVTFFLEETPLQIYKTGCVYLAILGQAGAALPTEQLRAIAAALPRPALDPCE